MREKKKIITTLFLAILLLPLAARETADTVCVFRFVAGDDMFYVPWGGNGEELERLESLVARHRERMLVGEVRLQVDGYGSAGASGAAMLSMARLRSNRVKSELILRQGLNEGCFVTRNHAAGGDSVMVRVVLPAVRRDEALQRDAREVDRQRLESERLEAERAGRERRVAEQARADSLAAWQAGVADSAAGAGVAEDAPEPAGAWYAGVQLGMPFGVSAMSSFGDGRTTPGWSLGIHGGYRFNALLSLELQAAWGQLFMNRRGCCPDYWTGSDGNRYEAAVAGMDGWYWSDLRSRVFTQRYALHLNVNLLGLFVGDSRWSVGLSPGFAAVGTGSDFRLSGGKSVVLEGGTRWHLGLGGNLQADYALGGGLRLGVYTGLTWLSDRPLDGTPDHLHDANYTWETGLRLGWTFGSKGKEEKQ